MIYAVVLAVVYGNFLEYVLHRYVLHKLGQRKSSFWSFHWYRHHRLARRNKFIDTDYQQPLSWETTGKELAGLFVLGLVHTPLILVSPVFFACLCLHGMVYYFLHARSHTHPMWGKRYLRWHYDHHMIGNQQHNWCVTFPLWDYVLGTRRKRTNAAKPIILKKR